MAAFGRPGRGALRCSALLDPRLAGTWDKDMSRSTSMDDVADLVGLSGLVREGIKLIRGCELSVNGGTFTMGVFSVLPIVKVRTTALLCHRLLALCVASLEDKVFCRMGLKVLGIAGCARGGVQSWVAGVTSVGKP